LENSGDGLRLGESMQHESEETVCKRTNSLDLGLVEALTQQILLGRFPPGENYPQ